MWLPQARSRTRGHEGLFWRERIHPLIRGTQSSHEDLRHLTSGHPSEKEPGCCKAGRGREGWKVEEGCTEST